MKLQALTPAEGWTTPGCLYEREWNEAMKVSADGYEDKQMDRRAFCLWGIVFISAASGTCCSRDGERRREDDCFTPNTWSCKTAHRGSVWFIKIRNSSLACLHGTTFSCGLTQIWWITCALMEEHFSHWWIFRAFVRLTGLMWSFDEDELQPHKHQLKSFSDSDKQILQN